MPDEIEVEVPETVEESVEKSAPKISKMFSQDEVNGFIKERVAREKASKKKVEDEFEIYKKDIDEELSFYKGIIQKQVDKLEEEAPESVKKLLEKLSLIDRYEYLMDETNAVILKKVVPTLPKPRGELKAEERFKDIKYKH
jgi:hypothetical protein